MKRNLYFRTVFRPHNPIKDAFFSFGYDVCLLGRIPLEVFIKRNFGARYLSLTSCLVAALFFALLPSFLLPLVASYQAYNGGGGSKISLFFFHFLSWYIFVGCYVFLAWKRRKETRPKPNEYDFSKFSLYTGELVPGIANLLKRWSGIDELRTRETLVEPFLFFVAAIALILTGQYVGWLVLVCSNLYSSSYIYAWHLGSEFTWDRSDELLLNKQQEAAFIHGLDPSFTDGVQFRTARPTSEEERRRVSQTFTDDDDEAYVVS